jgi:hypothetical protein
MEQNGLSVGMKLASLIPKDLKCKKNYLMFNIHKNTEVYISTITIRVETR